MGAVHGMTGGASPKDPIIPQELDRWQQDIYDQTFEVSSTLGSFFNPLGAHIIPKILPELNTLTTTIALKPVTIPVSPPVNNDRVNSTSNSQSSSNQNTTPEVKPSKVQKTKTTESIGGGKYTKTTEVRPSKISPGQSRAEIIKYKNSQGITIKVVKDSYDRGNTFQHRKFKLPRYEPSFLKPKKIF